MKNNKKRKKKKKSRKKKKRKRKKPKKKKQKTKKKKYEASTNIDKSKYLKIGILLIGIFSFIIALLIIFIL